MSNALSHVTVLDLSRILAGPWAAQVLADLGADGPASPPAGDQRVFDSPIGYEP
ncbi:MAG: CoA-transferase family [Actinomycetota bacterium]|jgi:hypothetical protein|nr:CoA-transferase family [Actinomycetota bacterium]